MISLEYNPAGGWVKITASGTIDKAEIGQNLQDFLSKAAEFKGRIAIINDISGLEARPEALLTLTKIHLKMVEMGKIGQVIRVIGKSKALLVKLSQLDRQYRLEDIQYVPTVADAEALIAKR